MWRAMFFAIGTVLIIVGLECLAVDKFVMRKREPPPAPTLPFETAAKTGPNKILDPPPWAPWTLMGTGAVVCLYSITLPKQLKGG